LDPENHQLLEETNLPTPMTTRVYVNLLEGINQINQLMADALQSCPKRIKKMQFDDVSSIVSRCQTFIYEVAITGSTGYHNHLASYVSTARVLPHSHGDCKEN